MLSLPNKPDYKMTYLLEFSETFNKHFIEDQNGKVFAWYDSEEEAIVAFVELTTDF